MLKSIVKEGFLSSLFLIISPLQSIRPSAKKALVNALNFLGIYLIICLICCFSVATLKFNNLLRPITPLIFAKTSSIKMCDPVIMKI